MLRKRIDVAVDVLRRLSARYPKGINQVGKPDLSAPEETVFDELTPPFDLPFDLAVRRIANHATLYHSETEMVLKTDAMIQFKRALSKQRDHSKLCNTNFLGLHVVRRCQLLRSHSVCRNPNQFPEPSAATQSPELAYTSFAKFDDASQSSVSSAYRADINAMDRDIACALAVGRQRLPSSNCSGDHCSCSFRAVKRG